MNIVHLARHPPFGPWIRCEDDGNNNGRKRHIDTRLLEEIMLANLEEMKRHQSKSQKGDRYSGFSFFTCTNIERICLSPKVGSAVIEAFQRECASGRGQEWKVLRIRCVNFDANDEVLLEVLSAFRRLRLFNTLNISYWGATAQILQRFVMGNPTLKNLEIYDYTLDVARQLRCILDTRTRNVGEPGALGEMSSCMLKTLTLVIGPIADIEVAKAIAEAIAEGLKRNASLQKLALRYLYGCGGKELDSNTWCSLLRPLTGHCTLQELTFQYHAHLELLSSVGVALASVLRNAACRIHRVDICAPLFQMHDEHDNLIKKLDVLDFLQGSCSVEEMFLRGSPLLANASQRMIDLIDCCPLLRKLDLGSTTCGEPFWADSLPTQEQGRQTNSNFCYLHLSSDLIYTPRICDKELRHLLLRYPALGEIVAIFNNPGPESQRFLRLHRNPYYSIQHLMLFNYMGRGRLQSAVPPCLWRLVLARWHDGIEKLCLCFHFAKSHSDSFRLSYKDEARKQHGEAVQASVLFCLLKENPTQVTAEACQAAYHNVSSDTNST